jgi:predicted Zn-dependent protease
MNKCLSAIVTAVLLICGTVLGGVATSGCSGGRFGNMLSKSDQVRLGQQAAVDVERQYRIITSGPQYDQLERVSARIIPQAQKDFDVPYTVKLIDSKEVNAFALPGGPIYFYKGLLDLTTSDDELASVVGHEAAHVVKQHSAKQISDAQAKNIIAQVALGRASQLAQIAAGLALQIQQLKYSRGDEAQSDEAGFRYLVSTGYDPDAMASMFRKLKEKGGSGGPEFLQSHPLPDSRIRAAEQRAEAYKQGRSRP